jgi:5-formyltetrahydrofolate cyclo-ligase
MLARRAALTPEDASTRSATITDLVCRLPIFLGAGTICSYMAIGREVQTAAIIHQALAQGKRVLLPRTSAVAHQLTLHQVTGIAQLVPGRYHIPEPPADAPQVDPRAVELFLIPGAVFDPQGNRLGYGAGYYDSLLADAPGWRIALAYALQLVPRAPVDPHDIPMHAIATEAGLINCRLAQRAGDHLRLRNIPCHGYHGVYPEERAQGVSLAFDIDLRLDLQWPGLTDELAHAVDYPAVYRLVQRVQSAGSVALLETLAERIAAAILQDFPSVAEVGVTVRKLQPPVGGPMDAVEISITRGRAWEFAVGDSGLPKHGQTRTNTDDHGLTGTHTDRNRVS